MPRKGLKLYVICPDEESSFFNSINKGINKAEEEFGESETKVEFLRTRNNSPSRQAELLTQVLDLKPDGLAIIPTSSTELNYLIDEAVDNDIPVVTFNNDAPYSKRFCYVGPDNYTSGKQCAELMANFFKQSGNVIIVSDNQNVYGYKQRVLGFKDKIKSTYTRVKIQKTLEYSCEDDVCYLGAMKELSKMNNIDGIFAASAGATSCITKVLNKMNLPSPPILIGFDPNQSSFNDLEKGSVNALIYQNPATQGYLALKTLHDYVSYGIIPEKENIYTKSEIITKSNLSTYLNVE